jgi:hypothetical protein
VGEQNRDRARGRETRKGGGREERERYRQGRTGDASLYVGRKSWLAAECKIATNQTGSSRTNTHNLYRSESSHISNPIVSLINDLHYHIWIVLTAGEVTVWRRGAGFPGGRWFLCAQLKTDSRVLRAILGYHKRIIYCLGRAPCDSGSGTRSRIHSTTTAVASSAVVSPRRRVDRPLRKSEHYNETCLLRIRAVACF